VNFDKRVKLEGERIESTEVVDNFVQRWLMHNTNLRIIPPGHMR
jgi:hypothetical protein